MLSLMNAYRRGLLTLAALAVSAGAVLVAQSAGGGPIAIDFFVSGPDGTVFDLRADEISLKVDGRARQIRSLRYVSLPNADPAGVLVDALPELAPPYGSNVTEANGRWVTIVVDHESIRPGAEKNTTAAAVRMVNSLGPRDRVSYLTMPNGGLAVDFTTDHEKVASALRRFTGTAPREPSDQDRSCRSRLLLNSMRDLIEDEFQEMLLKAEALLRAIALSVGAETAPTPVPLEHGLAHA